MEDNRRGISVADGKSFFHEEKTTLDPKHHEELLQAIYDNASVGMALLDMNGNFFQVNRALCEMLYYSEEELLSRNYSVTHPEDLERSEFVLAQLKQGKIKKNIMEKRYVRKDGSVIYALHNLSLIRDKNGEPFLFIIQAQDITHLKNTLKRALEADSLKTSFLQNLSHEVRTPANAIFGFYELLKDPDCEYDEKLAYIQMIQNGVEQFISILNNIIDISKVETHQLSVNRVTINIKELLQDLFRSWSEKVNPDNAPGVEFTFFMIESALPVLVECDPLRLKQAMGFLLDNAFKFTKFGRVTLGCHVIPEKEVILFVKDTGIGISKEKQEYILNKFRQGDESATRLYGGLGLGLTLAREFMALQGGKLWLQSEVDQGTAVYCSLPYKGHGVLVEQPTKGATPVTLIDLKGKTILVSEDTDNNYTVLDIWLKKAGANVLRARNGLEAIELCHHHFNIDLVLMDLQMPIVNGYSATREILAFRPGLPIIAQTAYSMDFDAQNAFNAGCVAYLVKPFDITLLFETITKSLKQTASH